MDSLHFYLFHCFDVGLRTKKMNFNDNIYANETTKHDKYFDKEFSRISNDIRQKRSITSSYDRFSSNKNSNKYNIKTFDHEEIEKDSFDDITFLDALYSYLQNNQPNQNICVLHIKTLNNIVINNEYDSDTVKYDIVEINNNGNIAIQLNNDSCIQDTKHFITSTAISSASFSIGFRFYYWEYYKKLQCKQITNGDTWNINDHSGYNICDLYIIAKYNSFKEEIAHYRYFSLKRFTNETIIKVNKYMNANIVKGMKAVSKTMARYAKHYRISVSSPFTFSHLLSLVLYCDYDDLSTDFSSSFRKIKKYETLSNIKKRNSKYYYFSKYLRETVECYGQCSCRKPRLLG
eukprot:514475_1